MLRHIYLYHTGILTMPKHIGVEANCLRGQSRIEKHDGRKNMEIRATEQDYGDG
jgi:hypothetical protein